MKMALFPRSKYTNFGKCLSPLYFSQHNSIKQNSFKVNARMKHSCKRRKYATKVKCPSLTAKEINMTKFYL